MANWWDDPGLYQAPTPGGSGNWWDDPNLYAVPPSSGPSSRGGARGADRHAPVSAVEENLTRRANTALQRGVPEADVLPVLQQEYAKRGLLPAGDKAPAPPLTDDGLGPDAFAPLPAAPIPASPRVSLMQSPGNLAGGGSGSPADPFVPTIDVGESSGSPQAQWQRQFEAAPLGAWVKALDGSLVKRQPTAKETAVNTINATAARFPELAGQAVDLAVNLKRASDRQAADATRSRIAAGQGTADDARFLQEVESPDPIAAGLATGAQALRAPANNAAPPTVSIDDVLANPLRKTVPFVLESGLRSVPDMLAAATLPASYIASLTEGSAEQRVANNNRAGAPGVADLLAALPGSVAQAGLERFGARRLFGPEVELAQPGALNAAKRIAGETAIQGTLGAAEETAGSLGETVGTQQGVDPAQLGKTALAGFLSEAGVGGVAQTLHQVAAPRTPAEAGTQAADALLAQAKASKAPIIPETPTPPVADALPAEPVARPITAAPSTEAAQPSDLSPDEQLLQRLQAREPAFDARQPAAIDSAVPPAEPEAPTAQISANAVSRESLPAAPANAGVPVLDEPGVQRLAALGQQRRQAPLPPVEAEEYQSLLEADRHAGKVGGRIMPGILNLTAYREADQAGQLQPAQAFMDLDNFKAVNDTYGHAMGDEVIAQLGAVLRESAGDGNVFHRSGDEFTIQGANPEAVQQAADRARQALATTRFRVTLDDGSVRELTGAAFSYGVGSTITEAEHAQAQDKQARAAAGLRTERSATDRRNVAPPGRPTDELAGGDAELGPAGPEDRAPGRVAPLTPFGQAAEAVTRGQPLEEALTPLSDDQVQAVARALGQKFKPRITRAGLLARLSTQSEALPSALQSLDVPSREAAHDRRTPPSGIPANLPATKTPATQRLARAINRQLDPGRRDRLPARFRAVDETALPDSLRGALRALNEFGNLKTVIVRNLNPTESGVDFNGVTLRDGTLFVDETAQHPVTTVAAHEFSHQLERDRPDLYRLLADEVQRQGRLPEFAANLAKRGEAPGREVSELVGDAVGDALTDRGFLESLAQRNPSKFRQLADRFLAFLDSLLGRIRDIGSHAYLRDVQAFRNVLADVLEQFTPAERSPIGDTTEVPAQQSRTPDQTETPEFRRFSDKSQAMQDGATVGGMAEPTDNVPALKKQLAQVEKDGFDRLRKRGVRGGPEWDAVVEQAAAIRRQLFALTGDYYGQPRTKITRPSSEDLEAPYASPSDVPRNVRLWVQKHSAILTSDATDAVRWGRIENTLRDERYPDGDIEIFRAVADGDEIRPGDWVTTEREYAEEHLRRYLDGRGSILSETVNGRDVLVSPTGNYEEAIYAPRSLSGPVESAAGNVGTFDPTNPDIRFQKRAPQDAETPPDLAVGGGGGTVAERTQAQATPEASSAVPEETPLQAARRIGQDKFNRFKVLQEDIELKAAQGAGYTGSNIHAARDYLVAHSIPNPITDATDVYQAETTMSGKIAARAQDFRELQMQPLIRETQAAGVSMQQVADYLKMQHAPEANVRARKIHKDDKATAFGVTDKQAEEAIAAFDKNQPNLKAIANRWRDITEQTKQILLTSGILDQDAVKAWEDTYSFYVPVKGAESTQPGPGKGLSVNGKTKRRLGHGLRDEAILENILRDHERAIAQDEHNQVGKTLLRFGLEIQNDNILTIDKPVKRQVLDDGVAYDVAVDGSPLRSFAALKDARAFMALDALKTKRDPKAYTIERSTDPHVVLQASPLLAENEVNVYVGGQAVRIQLTDPIAARAYTNLGVEGLNGVLSGAREVNNFLSKAYTGYSPDFLLRNPIRDAIQGSATLTGELGAVGMAKTFANYPHAAKELVKHFLHPGSSPLVSAYRANGGSTGASYLSDLERINADMMAAYNEYAGVMDTYRRVFQKARSEGKSLAKATAKAAAQSGLAGIKNTPIFGHFLALMEHLNAVTENALRVATFQTAQTRIDPATGQNYTPAKAAALAKNLMNFNRRGEISNQMGALYLFFNPNIQGTDVLVNTLGSSRHRNQARTLAGLMVLAGYGLAQLARSGGDEDEKRWAETPDGVKNRNLMLSFGQYQFTLPVPYGYGVFHALGNALSDYEHGRDGWEIGLSLTSTLLDNFSPFGNPLEGEHGPFQLIPTLPKMALGPSVNEDSYGRPIVPQRFNEAKPDAQLMNRRTKGTLADKAAQALNELTGGSKYERGAIDVSPETLKFWVSSLTGGAGKFAVDAINAPLTLSQGVVPDVRDVPIARVFVREPGISDTRAAYWAKAEKAQEAAEAFRAAVRAKDIPAARELLFRDRRLILLSKVADAQQGMIKALRDEQDRLRQDDTLTLPQKDKRMKAMEVREQRVYDAFLRAFDTTQKKD